MGKIVRVKPGKGENQIVPSESQRRQITAQAGGAALAQEICFVELGNQLWDSWSLGNSSVLIPGAPGGAPRSLMGEEHPDPSLALLEKGHLERMMSEDQRSAVNDPISLWIGQLGPGTLSEDTQFHLFHHGLSPLAGSHFFFSCI